MIFTFFLKVKWRGRFFKNIYGCICMKVVSIVKQCFHLSKSYQTEIVDHHRFLWTFFIDLV